MHFSQTALIVLPLFATFVICAPIAERDTLDLRAPTENIADAVFPRAPQTKAQLTAAYHQAENDAKSALASAKSMDASLKGKAHQAADTAKMTASLLTAYRSGHEAEKLRGNWMTQYGGSSLENVDLGHANAVQWIDKNIMQPTEALAKTWKVSL